MGRPSREAAKRLDTQILDVAERLFLTLGFEANSMELVSAEAAISKRTVYLRYPNKDALFIAVIDRAVARRLSDLSSPPPGTLQKRLERVALDLIARSLDPDLNALLRTVIAAATRFPKLSRGFVEHGHAQAVTQTALALKHEVGRDGSRLRWPAEDSAEQFLNLVVLHFSRGALFGLDLATLRADAKRQVPRLVATFIAGAIIPGKPA